MDTEPYQGVDVSNLLSPRPSPQTPQERSGLSLPLPSTEGASRYSRNVQDEIDFRADVKRMLARMEEFETRLQTIEARLAHLERHVLPR
jgi:hypothetical protein